MSFKRTDLAKQLGLKIRGQMQHSAVPGRFAQAAGQLDRREQRKLDQAAGLVPFAVKLNQALVARLTELAAARQIPLNDLVDEVVRAGLAQQGDAVAPSRPAATPSASVKVSAKVVTEKATKPPTKKAPADKASATKAPAKTASPKTTSVQTAAAPKAPAKKAPAQKPTAKKAPAKKAAAKKIAPKAAR